MDQADAHVVKLMAPNPEGQEVARSATHPLKSIVISEMQVIMAEQNIYDNPDFYRGYCTLPRSAEGLAAVYEWPAFQRLLPSSLVGLRVLDLGSGFGHFAREARDRGASAVVGVDISERMLAEAQSRGDNDRIRYVRSSLEAFDPAEERFDLVVSMLAIHYIADHAHLFQRVARWLEPKGRFAFSVEHPIFTASGTSDWHRGPDGLPIHWPVDRYRDEGARRTKWFVDGVEKYHRTIETYVNTLIQNGFILARLEEPEAESRSLLDARPTLREERRRPPFLLIAADRSS